MQKVQQTLRNEKYQPIVESKKICIWIYLNSAFRFIFKRKFLHLLVAILYTNNINILILPRPPFLKYVEIHAYEVHSELKR